MRRSWAVFLVFSLPASVHAQARAVVLVAPGVAAQSAPRPLPAPAMPFAAPQAVPLEDPAPAPGSGCPTELACQQDMDVQTQLTEMYTEDMDTAAGKALSTQRVGFDAQLGIFACAVVGVIIVPLLLRPKGSS